MSRLCAASLAVVLVAGSARAEAPGFAIDYDLLFEREAGAVQHPSPGVEHLELPGPVIVERRGGRVRATDQSGWGPAGCALDRLVTAAAAVLSCPDLFSEAQRDRVAGQLLRGVAFFAANTVPAMDEAQAHRAMRAALARERATLALSCASRDAAPLAFAAHIAEDPSLRRFGRIFETPRLPVTAPCH
ncbi:hypothetical protein [Salipiger bermudensis]|uniref:hypothetical protein n=1 Tax=Salipiger bermudensis TaxID=344736 RepID=UPI001CD31B95|nr:hypothetical protein [Salipiger bermudensis]MCA0962722.1 hypothetical protein [Salipiger bermudensis]